MKVIEHGKLDEWSKQFTCKGCKAVLKAEQSDLLFRVTDAMALAQQYQDEVKPEFYVSCPICYTELVIKDVPPVIQDALQDKLRNK